MSCVLSGLPAWVVQRLSAGYLLLYSVSAVVWFVRTPALDYTLWHRLFAQPLVAVATALFILALLLHAWVGVRDVILDYAGPFTTLRLLLLTLLGGWLLGLAVWGARILLAGVGR